MAKKIGLIAEDRSDEDVIKELIAKFVERRRFQVKSFLGHGCGKIKGKCKQWAENLRARGCTSLILVQDLDNKPLFELKNELQCALLPSPIIQHQIVIPVQMIEAWLLCDVSAIQKALKLPSTPGDVGNPELLPDPKSKLNEAVFLISGKTKRYLNTIHNYKIAAEASVDKLRTCSSFHPLEGFIRAVFNM